MGWRSWKSFGFSIDQTMMLEQVKALTIPGPNGGPSLRSLGYDEIGIDDGWQMCDGLTGKGTGGKAGGFHDEVSGKPLVNENKFPDMLAMTRSAHAMDVKMGWYMNNC